MRDRFRQTLPKINPIRWRKSGYGTQVLRFMNSNLVGDARPILERDRDHIQRGYVKVLKRFPSPYTIDTALTVTVALRRIRKLEATQGAE